MSDEWQVSPYFTNSQGLIQALCLLQTSSRGLVTISLCGDPRLCSVLETLRDPLTRSIEAQTLHRKLRNRSERTGRRA